MSNHSRKEAPLTCPECGKECCWVPLSPYKNQVSGHHRVMLLDGETICKPLMPKEYAFYQAVPLEISRFVPKLKGVTKVCAQADENGHDILFAMPITKESKQKMICNCNKKGLLAKLSKSSYHDPCQWKYTSGEDESKTERVYEEHPWVQKVQQMSFEKNMHKTEGSKLILLEHIGSKFKRPCTMDLKMGVRQHGDDATEIKIKDHKERCEMSTSSSLGVRLCGMQIYDPATHTYFYIDKYTGRKLDPVGFEGCLFHFLNNGKRTDVLRGIKISLENLYKSVESLETCRFFCSSLLLMYEGNIDTEITPNVEVRMIDFANVTLFNEKHSGPDDGYLFGVRNLIKALQNIEDRLLEES